MEPLLANSSKSLPFESFEASTTSIGKNESTKSSGTPLPLGWTRVVRRRQSDQPVRGGIANDETKSSVSTLRNAKDDDICCNDANCAHILRQSGLTSNHTYDTAEIPNSSAGESKSFTGTAIICLHDPNPPWFQGYFFPSEETSSLQRIFDVLPRDADAPLSSWINPTIKPWGIMGVQEEIDDCLQCSEGGYRQISLTIDLFKNEQSFSGIGKGRLPPKCSWKGIEWTGGDMMKLVDGTFGRLRMKGQQILTGPKAAPVVTKLFGNLLKTIGQPDGDLESQGRSTFDSEQESVLDALPDVVIVVGNMEMTISLLLTSPDT